MTTKSDIKQIFQTNDVKQYGSKQLFRVANARGTFLVSYKTIIGVFDGTAWNITMEKYSKTTTAQTNWFIRNTPFSVNRVSELVY